MFSWQSITIEQHADRRPLGLGCSPGEPEPGDRKARCSSRRGNLVPIRPPYHRSRQLTPVHATSKITPSIKTWTAPPLPTFLSLTFPTRNVILLFKGQSPTNIGWLWYCSFLAANCTLNPLLQSNFKRLCAYYWDPVKNKLQGAGNIKNLRIWWEPWLKSKESLIINKPFWWSILICYRGSLT